jgi:conjugal transfer pilus assembly protein TraK
MMSKIVLVASVIISSYTGAVYAQQSDNAGNSGLPSLPIIDARSGRLTEDQIQREVQSQSTLQQTSAQNSPVNLEDIMAQVRAQTPQLYQAPVGNNVNSGGYIYQKAVESYSPTQTYDLNPMDSIIIPVGQGVMNSIVTNYKMIAVKTSHKTGLYEPEGGFLYATIRTNERVGLILFEEGVPESQIAVTLVPIDAPPSVININVAMTEAMNTKSRAFQKEIREQEASVLAQQEQTYYSMERTQRIIQMLTPVAQGDLPRGFSLSTDIPKEHMKPCAVPIYQHTGQRLMGGKEVIDVVLVKNTSNGVYQMREEMCASDDVLAVALYRKSYLQPGEEMELYILRDKFFEREQKRSSRRPRLTSGE